MHRRRGHGARYRQSTMDQCPGWPVVVLAVAQQESAQLLTGLTQGADGLGLGDRLPGRFLRRLNPPELMLDTMGSGDHQPAKNTSKAGHVRRHGRRPGEPSFPLPAGFIRRWLLDRGGSATHRSGGNQSAHQSMINRRLMIVPPAMPSVGCAEQFDERTKKILCLLLKTANMRVDRW